MISLVEIPTQIGKDFSSQGILIRPEKSKNIPKILEVREFQTNFIHYFIHIFLGSDTSDRICHGGCQTRFRRSWSEIEEACNSCCFEGKYSFGELLLEPVSMTFLYFLDRMT